MSISAEKSKLPSMTEMKKRIVKEVAKREAITLKKEQEEKLEVVRAKQDMQEAKIDFL